MRRLTWLTVLALTSWSGCGDDADDDGDKGSEGTDTSKVSQALTAKVAFKNGLLKEGSIPDPKADKVSLAQDNEKLQLKPGVTSLMSLDVTNPDEDEDPVESALLQFEETDEHIEVTKGSAGGSDAGDAGLGDPSLFEISFEVGEEICEGLCNKSYEIKMEQAVKLEGGDVSPKLIRIFELDCSDDGDPDQCGGAAKPDAGMAMDAGARAGNGSTGGAGMGSTGSATAAGELRRQLNAANMAACACPGNGGGTACEAAPFTADAITCIEQKVRNDAALEAGASCLGAGLSLGIPNCACTATCYSTLVPEGLGECTAVDALSTELDDCGIETATP